jgi:hypothetical protein
MVDPPLGEPNDGSWARTVRRQLNHGPRYPVTLRRRTAARATV